MRLDLPLDSFYVLGSLWASLTGAPVCSTSPSVSPMHEVARAPMAGPPDAVTAFIDVNVVPMDSERVLANQTVLVEGGRIAALGPGTKVKIPVGAVRVDGRGKYLIPGLGAMHDHFTRFYDKKAPPRLLAAFPSYVFVAEDGTVQGTPTLSNKMAMYLASGLTAIASLNDGGEPDVSVDHLPVVNRFLETLPGPRAYIARTMGEMPETVQWSDRVAASVASAKADGYAHFLIQSSRGYHPLFFDSLLVAARRVGLPITAHAHLMPFEEILKLGRAGGSFDHLNYLFMGSLSPDDIQARAAAIQRAGVWFTPTLRCVIGNRPLSSLSAKLHLQHTKTLHDAGVKLLAARDDQWEVYDELVAFVQAGLTPYQALVTSTRNIAEYFGRLDEIGTVTVGKQADLVLLNGNPLADIRHTLEPAGVVIRGRWLDRTALDQHQLAFPQLWLKRILMQRRVSGRRGGEPLPSVQSFATKLAALLDSLELANPNKVVSARLRRRVAAEFGALRASVTPELQHEWFDPHARSWMREQARKGDSLVVPGVALVP